MRAISLVATAAIMFASAAYAGTISGAGATFPYPVYAKWAEAYHNETGVRLNYQSIGSGGGIQQIKNRTVTFGASDMPLTTDILDRYGLVQFPTVMGGVVPVVHVRGIRAGEITLDGDTLTKIYLGKIKRWDDPAIVRLNTTVHLPHQYIAVVHRSDGSGTTFIFTNYLSKVSGAWKSNVGSSTSVEWPVGIGAKGNEGVAAIVGQTDGSIGYVEYAYVKQNGLTYTKLINRSGTAVAPTAEAFQSAAAGADWAHAPGFRVILTDQQGDGSWPIAGATFILIHKRPQDVVAAREALKFFSWAYAHGNDIAAQLDYVPMPDKVVHAIKDVWTREITDGSGNPVLR